jgi:3-phosphoshikimate 1-carboxyvinyltransferase
LKPAYGPLQGEVSLPGDKSISHRAVLFSLLSDETCSAAGWLDSQDTRSSLGAIEALGGTSEFREGVLYITPPAAPPRAPELITIDCANSGTTVRLLLGLLAGWLDRDGAVVRLVGDASLSNRPMARVVDPLRQMGADIEYQGQEGRLPIVVRGARLKGCQSRLKVPSAQVKSALQLAGLFAQGQNIIEGADGVRDHTERLLAVMGSQRQAYHITVPRDPSAAAFFQVAAALIPGSSVTVHDLSLNPGRAGALAILHRAGVQVDIQQKVFDPAEPMGSVTTVHDQLQAFTIAEDEVPSLIDELPILAVLATQCTGTTTITGAHDLRVKESDRIAAMTVMLKSLGADITEQPDGWTIIGPTKLQGGSESEPVVVATHGDHRVAMSAAIAALVTEGHVALDDDQCVGVSFPDFFVTLDALNLL